MNKLSFFILSIICAIVACKPPAKMSRSKAYKGIYEENPVTVLIMPPINKILNVDAKDYFHSTLNIPLANEGYYVIPPFLSMEILKQESAYDAEMFLNQPVNKFGEVFGADLVLFTVIHRWDKSLVPAHITVQVEYILKSTKTNSIVYTRKAKVKFPTGISTGLGGGIGLLANIAATVINTAATTYVRVARESNNITFLDLPRGKYSKNYRKDSAVTAGKKEFSYTIKDN